MNRRAPDLILTPCERDLVRAVIVGRTNREIANELHLGEPAVKNVPSIVYQKSRCSRFARVIWSLIEMAAGKEYA